MIPVELLVCPGCRSALTLDVTTPPRGAYGTFGVLASTCGAQYPVVDDVPIFTPTLPHFSDVGGKEALDAPTSAEVIRRVQRGETLDLLAELLVVPWCPWPLNRLAFARRLVVEGAAGGINTRIRTAALTRRLGSGELGTAEDWFAFYHLRGSIAGDSYSYFAYRFAQPRHLAALALLATIPDGPGPVVDLACGNGHLAHHLSHHRPSGGTVGIDLNFSQLWIARHLIAPKASFVCADAALPLPIKDGAAAAVVCSDAFSYLPDQEARLHDFARCAGDGPIMLLRVGNRLVAPNEGVERTPTEWADFLQQVGPWRMRSEDDLLDGYLRGDGAQLARQQPPEELLTDKWLSTVIDPTERLLTDHKAPERRPHLLGSPALNPIFQRVRRRNGPRLRFTWPSTWYRFENDRMATYHAHEINVEAVRRKLAGGTIAHDAEADLIDQFVIIGLPDRFMRPLQRRLAVRLRWRVGSLLKRFAEWRSL